MQGLICFDTGCNVIMWDKEKTGLVAAFVDGSEE